MLCDILSAVTFINLDTKFLPYQHYFYMHVIMYVCMYVCKR